jgi:hypothetical protein
VAGDRQILGNPEIASKAETTVDRSLYAALTDASESRTRDTDLIGFALVL